MKKTTSDMNNQLYYNGGYTCCNYNIATVILFFINDYNFRKNEKKRGMKTSSSKQYLEYILDQLPSSGEISYRPMMGEYIIYYRGKIVGGIYDDRFLVKPTKSALEIMPDADRESPYEGANEMLLVDNVDNREFLAELLTAMYEELPAPKKKK